MPAATREDVLAAIARGEITPSEGARHLGITKQSMWHHVHAAGIDARAARDDYLQRKLNPKDETP